MQYYPILEISIRACKSGGIDTKVHGVSIIGRVDMNEDEVAANFSFLTVEDASQDTSLIRRYTLAQLFVVLITQWVWLDSTVFWLLLLGTIGLGSSG